MTLYTRKHKVPFQIDTEDLELVSKYTWSIAGPGYPMTHIDGGKRVCLHEVLMGKADKGFEWDHIDRNKLNNSRSNLRMVKPIINKQNQGMYRNNTSGAKGVYWARNRNKWMAYIRDKGKMIGLGYFVNFQDAIEARKIAEIKYRGNNAS